MSKRIYTTDDVEKGLVAASLDPVKQSKRFELARKTFVSKVVDEGADSRTALEAALEAGVRGMKPLANADERLAKAHADLGLDKSTFQNKLTVAKTGASGFGARFKQSMVNVLKGDTKFSLGTWPTPAKRTVIVTDIDELDLTEVAHVEDVAKAKQVQETLRSGLGIGLVIGLFVGVFILGHLAARIYFDHATYAASPWYGYGYVAWFVVSVASTIIGMVIGWLFAVWSLKRAQRREAKLEAHTQTA